LKAQMIEKEIRFRDRNKGHEKSAQRDANTARALTVDYEIRSRDPGHAHLGVVLWSLGREALSCISVPNLKRIALFVQKSDGPKFRPVADHLPGGAGPPKFNQLEMVTTCTYRPLFGEDRCTQFRVIMVTDTARPPQTHTHTDRQDRLQYTAPLASAQCNYNTLRSYA